MTVLCELLAVAGCFSYWSPNNLYSFGVANVRVCDSRELWSAVHDAPGVGRLSPSRKLRATGRGARLVDWGDARWRPRANPVRETHVNKLVERTRMFVVEAVAGAIALGHAAAVAADDAELVATLERLDALVYHEATTFLKLPYTGRAAP